MLAQPKPAQKEQSNAPNELASSHKTTTGAATPPLIHPKAPPVQLAVEPGNPLSLIPKHEPASTLMPNNQPVIQMQSNAYSEATPNEFEAETFRIVEPHDEDFERPILGYLVFYEAMRESYTTASTYRYGIANTLARAIDLGNHLFGSHSFAIFASTTGFYAVRIHGHVRPPENQIDEEEVTTTSISGNLSHGGVSGYYLIGLFNRADDLIVATNQARLTQIREELIANVALGEHLVANISGAELFETIDRLIDDDEIDAAANLIAEMGATAFGYLTEEYKQIYVGTLVRAGGNPKEEAALVALFSTITTLDELSAMMAYLDNNELKNEFINVLDDHLVELFYTVGAQFGEGGWLTPDELLEMLRSAILSPSSSMGNPGNIADAITDFVGNTLENLLEIPASPVENAVTALKLTVKIIEALAGNQETIQEIRELLNELGEYYTYAMQGAEIMELNDEFIERILVVIVMQLLLALIGIGNAHALRNIRRRQRRQNNRSESNSNSPGNAQPLHNANENTPGRQAVSYNNEQEVGAESTETNAVVLEEVSPVNEPVQDQPEGFNHASGNLEDYDPNLRELDANTNPHTELELNYSQGYSPYSADNQEPNMVDFNESTLDELVPNHQHTELELNYNQEYSPYSADNQEPNMVDFNESTLDELVPNHQHTELELNYNQEYSPYSADNQEPNMVDFNEHQEVSGGVSGTGLRVGYHHNELNAAEIINGLEVLYDVDAGRPVYVAYDITADVVDRRTASRRRNRSDHSVEGNQSSGAGYRLSGFDRGHLAQRQAFRGNEEAERAADQFTNITPQTPAINRGAGSPWTADERAGIRLAEEYGTVRVRIEPIYLNTFDTLSDGTPIPHAFTRIITGPDGQVLLWNTVLNQ